MLKIISLKLRNLLRSMIDKLNSSFFVKDEFSSSSFLNWPWKDGVKPEVYDREFEWPKISIVTPSFNQGQFIEATIRSILLQNYPNLEYIIIDGGSSDETIEVIKKYNEKITFWVSEPDKGQTDAINKGFKKATGDIVNWVNSDDQLVKGALYEVGLNWLTNKFDILIGADRILYQNSEKKITKVDVWKPKPWDEITDFLTPNGVVIPQSSTFIARSLVKELGYLNSELHYLMDWDLYFRIACFLKGKNNYSIEITKKTLATQLIHSDCKTFKDGEKFQLEYKQLLEDYSHGIAKEYNVEILKKRKELYVFEEVTSLKNKKQVFGLTKLLINNPWLFGRRMYWGALKAATSKRIGRARKNL